MEDYVPASVSGLLSKKGNTSKDVQEEHSVASQLFAPDTSKEEDVRHSLTARLEKLNKLEDTLYLNRVSKKKRKLTDAVYSREASLREADEEIPKKKKKKVVKQEVDESQEDEEPEDEDDAAVSSNQSKRDRVAQRENRRLKKSKLEKDGRTVFVGNLPTSATKKTLKDLFKEFGKIESIRFRSAAPADLKLPRKATVIKKEFHEKRNNINAYVVFEEKSSVGEAVSANGTLVDDLHIRVDKVLGGKDAKEQYDSKLSVFVGNLPFDVEEESVREHFEDCGDIEGVRIIRDRKTGLGKGFGFVLFKDAGAVGLATRLNDKKFHGRSLRVMRTSMSAMKGQGKSPGPGKLQGKLQKSQKPGAGPSSKFRMPTNVSSSSFQGMKAKKMTKLKKKMKNKKSNFKGKKTLEKKSKKPKKGKEAVSKGR